MSSPLASTESRQILRPPQFGLRTLLGMVTACGVLFALAQWLHPAAVALLAFLAVSVSCHVAGNALGTRLRQIGNAPDQADALPRTIDKPPAHHFAPPTLLSRRQSLGWLVLIATSVGITSGAIGGGLWTFVAAAGPPDVTSIATGVVAFSILGGMAAFLTIGFAQVVCAAFFQALSNPPPVSAAESGPESTSF